MKHKFLVPILTPFNADESVDYDALKKLTRALLDDGADGIYAGGSSAECFLLTEEERKKTLETVVAAADGAYVLAHIGCPGTKCALELARHAKRAGADAVASVPPFYYAFPFEGVLSYYRDLAGVGLPVTVYSLPSTRRMSVEEKAAADPQAVQRGRLRAAALSVWFSGHFSVCFSVACACHRQAHATVPND